MYGYVSCIFLFEVLEGLCFGCAYDPGMAHLAQGEDSGGKINGMDWCLAAYGFLDILGV